MAFELLERIAVADGGTTRTISLYEGDLAAIPPDHRADILVVSAFPGDYSPVPGTLIEALHTAGLSVAALAGDKLHDLRQSTGFWLSRPLGASGHALNVDQIACFEPMVLGSAPDAVAAMFRGLFPFLKATGEQTVAMPILASGLQGWRPADMLIALLDAACHWMRRGLPISDLKIVIRPGPRRGELVAVMKSFRVARASALAETAPSTGSYDVFLSYSSADRAGADAVTAALKARGDVATVFDFRRDIQKGANWQQELDRAVASSRSIVTLLSPDYFASPECVEELMQARLRHKRAGNVLVPIYWRELGQDLDLWLQIINFFDCREADSLRLTASIGAMPKFSL